MWIATSNGLLKYNDNTGAYFWHTSQYLNDRSLSETSVSCIYETDNNILWAGSHSSGINYSYLNLPFKNLFIVEDGDYALSSESVSNILHDVNGNTWFGYSDGTLERFDFITKTKTKIPHNSIVNPWGSGSIFGLFQDSKNDIYTCSWSGGVQKFNAKDLVFTPLTGSGASFLELFKGADCRDIEEDLNGNLWLAMHGKGVFSYNPKDNSVREYNRSMGLSNDWVFDIAIDSNNNVWVGAAHGLSKKNANTNSIKTYFKEDEETTSLSDNRVEYFKVTDDGRIWVGTSNGLNLFNTNNDNFFRLTLDNNQIETNIKSIEQDNSGQYWVATTNGLLNFVLKESSHNIPNIDKIYAFTTNDGLQSNYYNIGCSSKDREGALYFGSMKGLDFFNPNEIKPTNDQPILKIVGYKINGEIVYPGTDFGPQIDKNDFILLNHKQNILNFEYVAIHFNNVDRDKYSYKLKPLNNEWINVDNNKNIHFSNLKSGFYELSLMVETDKGLTDIKESIIKFHVKPPYWQTTFFRLSLIIIIASFLLSIMSLYTAYLRRKKLQLEKIVRSRTLELREKNDILHEQSEHLNETNTLLEERQQQIEEQTEELRAQSEELLTKNEELNKLVALKDKFFSIIAHDLKNPFNTILGFSELLKTSYENHPEEKRKRLIDYIYNSGKSAYSLLENLLTWSRSQTNRLEVKPNNYLVEHIIESNYRLIKGTLKQKKITFESNYDKNLTIWADESLINTVIRNLLSNAAKFSQQDDKISINARLLNEDLVQFEIKDTGVGLTKEEIDSLFKIDSKMSNPGTAGEKGTGLGMILCKEFVEKLNGKIWIESEKGVGTSVFFTIPTKSK